MPVEDPQFGEVWTTTDVTSGRIMQGIVADVSPTRVLFVSLTGHRVAVPLSRLRTNWKFVQPAPRRDLPPCERMGCTNTGMIEYDRGERATRTCPKHAPAGTQCRITTNYQPSEARNIRPGFECRSVPCPMCGDRDPAEDVRIAVFPARLWFCTSCSGRWATVPRIQGELPDLDHMLYTIQHELGRLSFEVDSILVLQGQTWDELRRSATVESDVTEAIPRVVVHGMQAFYDSTAVNEQSREFFDAVVRVRNNMTRQADRPVQRLGGSPSRTGVVGSTQNPVRPVQMPEPTAPMVYRPTASAEAATAEAFRLLRRETQEHRRENANVLFEGPASVEAPIPDVPIEVDSLWVQRMSGDMMVVLGFINATDGSEAISFRRNNAEEIEPSVTMTRRDFLTHHRPYVPEMSEGKRPPPMVEVSVNDEWECQDGSAILVTQVDHRKEMVFGDDLKTKKHRQIPFPQFIAGRWRKIVRRSIYDRIRRPEAFTTGSDED